MPPHSTVHHTGMRLWEEEGFGGCHPFLFHHPDVGVWMHFGCFLLYASCRWKYFSVDAIHFMLIRPSANQRPWPGSLAFPLPVNLFRHLLVVLPWYQVGCSKVLYTTHTHTHSCQEFVNLDVHNARNRDYRPLLPFTQSWLFPPWRRLGAISSLCNFSGTAMSWHVCICCNLIWKNNCK